jgi:hypothetical protein
MTDDASAPAVRDESHEIDEVIERLSGRFPTIDRTHVEDIVHDEAHQLDGGRVRDFIPVLVEHAAFERLRLEAPPAPLDPSAEEPRPLPTDEAQNLDPMEVEAKSRHTGLLLGDIDS